MVFVLNSNILLFCVPAHMFLIAKCLCLILQYIVPFGSSALELLAYHWDFFVGSWWIQQTLVCWTFLEAKRLFPPFWILCCMCWYVGKMWQLVRSRIGTSKLARCLVEYFGDCRIVFGGKFESWKFGCTKTWIILWVASLPSTLPETNSSHLN